MTWDDYLDVIDDYVPIDDLEQIETPDELIKLDWMLQTKNNAFRKGLIEFRNRNENQFDREVGSLIANTAGSKRLSEAQGILEGFLFQRSGIPPSDLELAKNAFPEGFRKRVSDPVLKGRITKFDKRIRMVEGGRAFAFSNQNSVKQDALFRRNPKQYLQDQYYLTGDEADGFLQ